MSKRSHFVTKFQVRATSLSELSLVSGEGSMAAAMVRSGMPSTNAQSGAVAERGVAR